MEVPLKIETVIGKFLRLALSQIWLTKEQEASYPDSSTF